MYIFGGQIHEIYSVCLNLIKHVNYAIMKHPMKNNNYPIIAARQSFQYTQLNNLMYPRNDILIFL